MGDNEKLDQILVTVSAMASDMAVMNAVLTGIQGDGGIVADIKNIGEKVSKQGSDLSETRSEVKLNKSEINHVKEDVKEQGDKIKTLFINSNEDRVAAAGVATKVAAGVSIVGVLAGAAVNHLMK